MTRSTNMFSPFRECRRQEVEAVAGTGDEPFLKAVGDFPGVPIRRDGCAGRLSCGTAVGW